MTLTGNAQLIGQSNSSFLFLFIVRVLLLDYAQRNPSLRRLTTHLHMGNREAAPKICDLCSVTGHDYVKRQSLTEQSVFKHFLREIPIS